MGKNTDKIKSILKKKNQLIGVILIAAIAIISIVAIAFIINGKKTITTGSKSSISTESKEDKEDAESATSTKATEVKTACGIKIKFIYGNKYWDNYDLTNAVFKTQEEYEDAVCIYIDEIAKLLNKEDWYEKYKEDTLYLKLVVEGNDYYGATNLLRLEEYDDTMPIYDSSGLENFTSNAQLYTITLNSAMFDHNIIPIVHQLTDLILYNKKSTNQTSSFSDSLRIGLDEYTQNYFGMGIASCNHSLDIHNYVVEQEKTFENNPTLTLHFSQKGLLWEGVTYRALGSPSLSSRNFGVECCSSFVAYLVQTYEIENVMKMVDAYDNSIYYLYNQNGLEGLIADWQQFLAAYPCKMTWDEINAYIAAFKSTHGY